MDLVLCQIVVAQMMPGMLLASGSGGGSSSVSTFLSVATEVFTWIFTQAATVVTFIFDHPVLLISLAMVLVFAAVGMVRRFLR